MLLMICDAEIGKRPLRSLTSADIHGLTRSIGARVKLQSGLDDPRQS